jgi:hypothetical protein
MGIWSSITSVFDPKEPIGIIIRDDAATVQGIYQLRYLLGNILLLGVSWVGWVHLAFQINRPIQRDGSIQALAQGDWSP